MKKKRKITDWDAFYDKVLNICMKTFIPVAALWAITGCIASVLYFTS